MSDHEQGRLLAGEDPDELVARATAEHRPIRTFCLFSGGGDSLVTAHRCRDAYDELVFIDTGTAVPGVEDFVHQAAAWLEKPVRILRQDFDAFRLLILGGEDWKGDTWNALGFPGAPQHGRCYNRLKERPLERLLREAKEGHPRSARILALTGVRRAESVRRKARPPISRKGSFVFVNPLIDWTNAELQRYKREHELPQSDVAALLHRSGECNCGAYAEPGEREMLQSLWPEWFEERIASLEREAAEQGLFCSRWGEKDCNPNQEGEAGLLCSSCDARQAELFAS